MPCNTRSLVPHRGFSNFGSVQNAMNCGISESWSRLGRTCNCGPNAVFDKVIEEYPITCRAPREITVDRVVTLAGIDNALFLVGDTERYRMNEFYNIVISDDVIGFQSFNFPAYLLLKVGDLHTLAVSTADIQNHPISSFLRQNQHLFGGHVGDLFELAPQDFNVEANREDCLPPQRIPVIRVIDPTSLNIRYLTIEVSWYECGHFVYREIFYIIPLVCANGNTLKGANLAIWDDDARTCGQIIRIPAKSTDNGSLKIADRPSCGCPPFRGRNIAFGGFRSW